MILKQNLKKTLTYFLKDCQRKFWRFRINSKWKSVPLCPIKCQPLKFFEKLHKCPLLIANIVKGAVSGLRQFLATESPWKIMKNTFYFILTNWICYWEIWFTAIFVCLLLSWSRRYSMKWSSNFNSRNLRTACLWSLNLN